MKWQKCGIVALSRVNGMLVEMFADVEENLEKKM